MLNFNAFTRLCMPLFIVMVSACVKPVRLNSNVKIFGGDSVELVDPQTHAAKVRSRVKSGRHLSEEQLNEATTRISKYLALLGMEVGTDVASTTLSELMNSSTQFLYCDDLNDWECLEADPVVTPAAAHRKAAAPDLGKAVSVNEALNAEFFFTERWQNKLVGKAKAIIVPENGKTVADELANKINTYGSKAVSIAMYGIDDINDTMKGVYEAFMSQKKKGSVVRAVMDMKGPNPKATVEAPYVFSYLFPKSEQDVWMLNSGNLAPVDYMYAETPDVAKALNEGIKSDDAAMARLEYPYRKIMHNKFVVLDGGKSGSGVWSGTANIAKTCMGNEENANVAVFIKNDAVAKTFLDEFNHMFEYMPDLVKNESSFVGASHADGFLVGRFHKNKLPITKRYFKFSDGNEVRVHFSPTDDAAHRLHLPFIYSAEPGDVLRISMFAAGGDEYMRALQFAAARGVDVRLVLGAINAGNPGSWLRDGILKNNPYSNKPKKKLNIVLSDWSGLNHHKSATLTRKNGRVETIILGSQNWSNEGNNENDENSIAIRNLKQDVPGGKEFNKRFDTELMKFTKEPEARFLPGGHESAHDDAENEGQQESEE